MPDPAVACVDGSSPTVDRTLDPRRLQSRFGLTPAEARVAAGLAAGASTAELAERFGVQVNTVHAHLKRALAKTQCARQTQLVSLVWRSGVEARTHTTIAAATGPVKPVRR